MSLSSKSEVISTDLNANKSVELEGVWAGGHAHSLCNLSSGSARVGLELNTSDLGAWVPCGNLMTASGHQSIEVPPGVRLRITITGFSAATGHVDIFEG